MRLIMTAGLLALPVSALAINTEPAGFYAGVGLSQVDYSGKTDALLTKKPSWTALELSGGYKHSPYVGLETRLGVGSSPDLLYGGIYYRTESANETAKTYLLVGYSGANIGTDSGDDVSLSGFSYGAGVGFPIGKNLNFNLEYRALLDDSDQDVSLNAFAASVDYRFDGSGIGFKGFGGSSQYDGGFYAGLGLARIDLSIDGPSWEEDEFDSGDEEDGDNDAPELEWNAIELIGGYTHSPLATVELRLGTTDNAGEGGVDFTLFYTSIYYRPSVNLGKAKLYGLLGYSAVRSHFQDEPDADTGETYPEEIEDYGGISAGVGIDISVAKNIDLGLEYRLLARDEVGAEEGEDASDAKQTLEFTAISANVSYRF